MLKYFEDNYHTLIFTLFGFVICCANINPQISPIFFNCVIYILLIFYVFIDVIISIPKVQKGQLISCYEISEKFKRDLLFLNCSDIFIYVANFSNDKIMYDYINREIFIEKSQVNNILNIRYEIYRMYYFSIRKSVICTIILGFLSLVFFNEFIYWTSPFHLKFAQYFINSKLWNMNYIRIPLFLAVQSFFFISYSLHSQYVAFLQLCRNSNMRELNYLHKYVKYIELDQNTLIRILTDEINSRK